MARNIHSLLRHHSLLVLLLFIGVLAFAVLLAFQVVRGNTLPATGWHFYRFETNSNDEAVDENLTDPRDATIVDSVPLTSGHVGQALDFSASNDAHVVMPHEVFQGVDDITISFWVKGNINANVEQTIFFSYQANSGDTNGLCLVVKNQDELEFYMARSSSRVTWNEGDTILDTAWHHVVIIRRGSVDPGEVDLYVDGVFISTESSWYDYPAITTEPDTFILGQQWVNDDLNNFRSEREFQGQLDEFMVFREGLSATQIAELYGGATPGTGGSGGSGSGGSGSGSGSGSGGTGGSGGSGSGGSASGGEGGSQLPLDGNLIALYEFENNTEDSSSNALHLQSTGNVTFPIVNGSPVARFAGLGDKVTVAIPDALVHENDNTFELTIQAKLFIREIEGYGSSHADLIDFDQDYDAYLQLYQNKWHHHPSLRNSGETIIDDDEWNITLNEWYTLRITVTTSGHTVVYLNGSIVGTGNKSIRRDRDNDWILTLGNMDGDLDDVVIMKGAHPMGDFPESALDATRGMPWVGIDQVYTNTNPDRFSTITYAELARTTERAKRLMDQRVIGGSGGLNLPTYSSSLSNLDAPISELKSVSQLFYDRLASLAPGFTTSFLLANNYPGNWTDPYAWTSTTADDSDASSVSLAMLKLVFSFDVTLDSDGDRISDMNELQLGLDPNDPDQNNNNVLDGHDDLDGDGFKNILEIQAGSDPTDPISQPSISVNVGLEVYTPLDN